MSDRGHSIRTILEHSAIAAVALAVSFCLLIGTLALPGYTMSTSWSYTAIGTLLFIAGLGTSSIAFAIGVWEIAKTLHAFVLLAFSFSGHPKRSNITRLP